MGKVLKSVLIVDGSRLIVERLSEMLRDLGIVKWIASSGDFDSAIWELSQRHPDIVLLDIELPGRNGMELLEFIIKNYPGTNVIMVSNKASESYRKKCKKMGASHFIDKSKDFELLPGIIGAEEILN